MVRTDLGGTAGDVKCEVEGVVTCPDHGVGDTDCMYSGPAVVSDGKFTVTGYSHDTGKIVMSMCSRCVVLLSSTL